MLRHTQREGRRVGASQDLHQVVGRAREGVVVVDRAAHQPAGVAEPRVS